MNMIYTTLATVSFQLIIIVCIPEDGAIGE